MTQRNTPEMHQHIFRIEPSQAGSTQRSFREHAGNTFHRFCSGDQIRNGDFWFEFVPGLRWMSTYNCKSSLYGDLMAGLTVGVMAVPQTVSFASMAGLPAAFGLYGCFAPVCAYALFGGSRHLAVGPVALISLLLGDSLSKLIPGSESNPNPNQPGDPTAQQAYNKAAIQVSLLVGLMYCVLSGARLGYLCNLLSRPIISSFLTAGSIIISMSQAKYILGYSIPPGNQLHVVALNLAKGLPGVRWEELSMGCAWLLVLYAFRNAPRLHRSLAPFACLGPISVAAASIGLVWGADLQARRGIVVVGRIQPGLPPLTVSWWFHIEKPVGMASSAASICFVGLLGAMSIAKALAEKHGDRVDAAIELRGLAAANIMGAAFGAFPATGSFARSAVSSDAGGITGLNNVVVAFVVGCTLFWLTPVFEHMPMNAMAAIVIMGVQGLLDFSRALFYCRVSGKEFVVWMATFLSCLFIGVDVGLAIGVGVALAFLFSSLASTGVQTLVKVPHTDDFMDVAEVAHHCGKRPPVEDLYANEVEAEIEDLQAVAKHTLVEGDQIFSCGDEDGEVEVVGGPLIIRPGSSLCFANAEAIKDQVALLIFPSVREEAKVEIHIDAGSLAEESGALLEQSSGSETCQRGMGFKQVVAERTRMVVVDMSAVNFMDASAAEVVLEAAKAWRRDGVGLVLANPNSRVLHTCESAGLLDVIGDKNVYWRVKDAYTACQLQVNPD